jgi:hypothetical protein
LKYSWSSNWIKLWPVSNCYGEQSRSGQDMNLWSLRLWSTDKQGRREV